ncbi:MAG: arginine--tRNA ligase [Candidatus Marinimicrobia bacterium]|jgi:arginyl-tRNA synthetase|nr:arginine--tRNA ligase [Candidatus Neomarinimicrobiota bacterium]
MKNALTEAFREIISTLNYPETNIVVQLPKNPEHGDFATNLALQLAGKLDENPREIAQILSDKLKTDYPGLVDSTDIAGPGFINISINKNAIVSQLLSVLTLNKEYGKSNFGEGKTAQVEFVSANPTGPLTVGHGRGAILGDVISSILQWNGYKVDREYYYNNAGRQMHRLGESVKSRYLELLGEKTEFPEEGYEGEYIVEIAQNLIDKKGNSLKDLTENTAFKDAAESNIFLNIEKTLARIGLKFDTFFNENSLYDSGAITNVVDTLRQKKLIYEKEGATWFKASEVGRDQDRVIIKSSGEPTYRLPDIAYHQNKFNRGYDLMVDVLGADHMDAYPDVLAAVEQLGCDSKKVNVIIHQFVTLTEDGEPVKMSTRKANYITLDELIDEVGEDVVRYFFIMRGINTHLNFDMTLAKDESDENPVFYLQYAHARLCNILKHAEEQGHIFNEKTDLSPLNLDSEIQLIKLLLEFPNIIGKAKDNLEPQTIATYLQSLAGLFHKYYAKERVVTEDRNKTSARLILVQALQIVLNNGLSLLGIHALERM